MLQGLFQNAGVLDALLPVLGIVGQQLLKLKNIPLKKLSFKKWKKDNAKPFSLTLLIVVIFLAFVPGIYEAHSEALSLLVGPSVFTALKAIFKPRKKDGKEDDPLDVEGIVIPISRARKKLKDIVENDKKKRLQ